MKTLVLSVMICLFSLCALGQGRVQYDKEPLIDSVEKAYNEAWKKVNYIDGYRIQIAALSTKNAAQKVYDEFKLNFPDLEVYLSYMEPTFRVRVGNFKTRIDAYRVQMQIQAQFPGSFITKDKISFREL